MFDREPDRDHDRDRDHDHDREPDHDREADETRRDETHLGACDLVPAEGWHSGRKQGGARTRV